MRPVLSALSSVYGLLVRLVRQARKRLRVRCGCKVVSVGNITVGGTGKTVMVQAVARFLKQQGHTVCVLSRGYRRPGRSRKGAAVYETMGDEPCMVSQNLPDIPVLVSPDRLGSARVALRDLKADTVVLDDGLQQWGMHKDLEIVMVDAANPFGNRRLLPRGLLREPLDTLAQADIFVLIDSPSAQAGAALRDELAREYPQALVVEAVHRARSCYRLSDVSQRGAIEGLRGRAVYGFCGIGNPGSFRRTLQECGVDIRGFEVFEDHHPFSEQEIEALVRSAGQAGALELITTQKDAVRIPAAARERFSRQITVVMVEAVIVDEKERFFDRLLRIYSV
jgi:tetraacyldisaccharide 4'-kinase